MIAGSKNAGFGYMVPLFINIFCKCAFRTFPDDAKGFKLIVVRFGNITVINVNDRIGRYPFFNLLQIGESSR